MKNITIGLLVFIVAICLVACVSQAKILYYDFPADITEEAKINNLLQIEKGRVLYGINCAQCHNSKEKGRIMIPDFTHAQLDAYEIRMKNEQHVNKLPESKITPEELEAIQFFFAYKKPSRPVANP